MRVNAICIGSLRRLYMFTHTQGLPIAVNTASAENNLAERDLADPTTPDN